MCKLRCENQVSFEKFNEIRRVRPEGTMADTYTDLQELVRSFLRQVFEHLYSSVRYTTSVANLNRLKRRMLGKKE